MSSRYTCHVPNERNEQMLATLRRYGATSATFAADGALLSVTLAPDSSPDDEKQSDTPQPKPRHATPRLIPRVPGNS